MADDNPGNCFQEIEILEKLFIARLDGLRSELHGIKGELLERFNGMDKALVIYSNTMEKNMDHLNDVRRDVIQDRGIFVTMELFRAELEKVYAAHKSNWIAAAGWLIAILASIFASLK